MAGVARQAGSAMSDDKPQHSGGFSGSLSVVRAGIVLVGFVIGVAILVAVGTRPTVSAPSSSAQTTVPPRPKQAFPLVETGVDRRGK